VELTSQAGHYSSSSSCPCFSQQSQSLLSFLWGKWLLSVYLLPPASKGQQSAGYCR
jgi:hypothetical protein